MENKVNFYRSKDGKLKQCFLEEMRKENRKQRREKTQESKKEKRRKRYKKKQIMHINTDRIMYTKKIRTYGLSKDERT